MNPLFYTAKTISPRDRSQIVSVRTGITDLDKRIIGLNKQEITVVSGLRSAAKSTVLSQISLNVINQGRKVALFSGELHESRVLEWLQLQAAGRSNTLPTMYENYFTVMPQDKDKINEWLEGKLYVYNNEYGNKIETLIKAMEYTIVEKGIDVLILDNLMSIDLGSTNFNKNEKQTEFIWKIKDMAQNKNVHIALVAHPRKSLGFLRVDDIAGTADLTNAADNVFIVHRVNNDFRRLSKLTMGWGDDNPIYRYDNALEVAKNRDLGIQDQMIGLHYDRASKQLSCDGAEIIFGWRA